MPQAPRIVRWTLPALLLVLVVGGAVIVSSSGIDDGPKVSEQQPPAQKQQRKQRRSKARRVTVHTGDTASAIAQRARLSLAELIDRNPGIDVGTLHPGQKLKIAP